MPLTDATSASKNMQLHKRGTLDLAKQTVRIELSVADVMSQHIGTATVMCASIATNALSCCWPGFSHRGMSVASLKLQMAIKNKEKVAVECAGDLVKVMIGETEGAEERHFIFPVMTVLKSIFLKE